MKGELSVMLFVHTYVQTCYVQYCTVHMQLHCTVLIIPDVEYLEWVKHFISYYKIENINIHSFHLVVLRRPTRALHEIARGSAIEPTIHRCSRAAALTATAIVPAATSTDSRGHARCARSAALATATEGKRERKQQRRENRREAKLLLSNKASILYTCKTQSIVYNVYKKCMT